MDIELDATKKDEATGYNFLDIHLEAYRGTDPLLIGTYSAPLISGQNADVQQAALCGFFQKGLCPQLPDSGVPLTEFLTGVVSFSEVDATVRQRLAAANLNDFTPQYETKNGQIIMTVQKIPKTEGQP